jgi:Tol biopolymer transport system component
MRIGAFVIVCALALSCKAWVAQGGEAPKSAPSEEEKKKLLDAETPEQKKLRAELAEMAKVGVQKVYYNSSFEGKSRLYAVNPDGSGSARIAPQGNILKDDEEVAYPHLSPDGKRLAFQTPGHKWTKEELAAVVRDAQASEARSRAPAPHGIWIMGPDGSDPHLVAMGLLPHWSADGRYLAYATYVSARDRLFCVMDVDWDTEGSNWHHPGVISDLYVSRWPADGVNVRITWHGGFTMQPQWWGPPAKETPDRN